MRVRVFGGWGFSAEDLPRCDFAKHGYDNGVPMGADLTAAPEGSSPKFLVRALRDPDGANLDRVQMVKGWLTADGTTREKVLDLAWSDDRQPTANGNIPSVGNTVDAETATYTNDIGAPILAAFWEDPDFHSALKTFYYVRVLEIPTPRWTVYDAVKFGIELDPDVTMITQDRAYTSPIWYTPG